MASTGVVTLPTPWVVPPTFQFEGNDGNWSTFALEIGTPPQTFHLFPATVSQDILVPAPAICEQFTGVPNCGLTRGVQNASSPGFVTTASNTYHRLDTYNYTSEQNLFAGIQGVYGSDVLSVAKDNGSGPFFGQSLPNKAIASYQLVDYWFGLFGLGTVTDEFSGIQYQSPLRSMKDMGLIPSLSFGYTAGKSYSNPQVPGSLILGGYDKARMTDSNLTVPISSVNVPTSLQVNVTSISADLRGGTQNLATAPMTMNIDSSTSQIWLPPDVCNKFATYLGLQQPNGTSPYYTVTSTTRAQLANSTFYFTIAYGNSHTMIQIPYQAFDLNYNLPSSQNNTRYFPIREGNASQLTLGRAFLQEAYIIVDWEHSNMTIGQATSQNTTTSISPISPLSNSTASVSTSPSSPSSSGSKSTPIGGIVGGVVGGVLGLIAIIMGIVFWRKRRGGKQSTTAKDVEQPPTAQQPATQDFYGADVVKQPPQSPEPQEPSAGWYPPEKTSHYDAEKSDAIGVGAYELSSPGAGPAELPPSSPRYELAAGAVPSHGVSNRGELMSTPIHEMVGSEVSSELDVGSRRGTTRRTPDRARSPPFGSFSPDVYGSPSPELFMSPIGSTSSVQVASSSAVHQYSSAQQEVIPSSEIVSSSAERDLLGGTASEIVVSSSPQHLASPLPVRESAIPLAGQPAEDLDQSHERGNTEKSG